MSPLWGLLALLLLAHRLPGAALPSTQFLATELDWWVEAMRQAKQRNVTLRVFYHTSTWRTHWRDIITEQLLVMDGRRPANFFVGEDPFDQEAVRCMQCSTHGGLRWLPTPWASVLDLADQLFLNVAHQTPGDFERVKDLVHQLPLSHRNKIVLHFNHTVARQSNQEVPANASELSVAEASTMMAMRDHCAAEHAAGRRAFVLFLHSKGACCSRRGQPRKSRPRFKLNREQNAEYYKHVSVSSWRELMNTFNIEFPSVCLRALLEGYVACGANLHSFPARNIGPHYSGTVFWANCDHFAALPPLASRFDGWAPELWPLNVSRHLRTRERFAFHCAYDAHRCGEDMYKRPCLRSTYRDKVVRYLSRWPLPASDVATWNVTSPWVQEHCHPLFSGPYINASFWANDSIPLFWDIQPTTQDHHFLKSPVNASDSEQ